MVYYAPGVLIREMDLRCYTTLFVAPGMCYINAVMMRQKGRSESGKDGHRIALFILCIEWL